MTTDERKSEFERLSKALAEVLGPEAVRRDEPLVRYTSLRIGGPVDILAVASTVQELRQVVALACDHEANRQRRVLCIIASSLVDSDSVASVQTGRWADLQMEARSPDLCLSDLIVSRVRRSKLGKSASVCFPRVHRKLIEGRM